MSLKIENSRRDDESRPVCVGLYTIPRDCIGAERFSFRIRLLFTLRHSNPK
jgi:hypothetical protein